MTSADAVYLESAGCVTAFGNAAATHRALVRGERALNLLPVLGQEGNDRVPLSLAPGRTYAETAPPAWLQTLQTLAAEIPGQGWGSARRPVFVTSSNFGVGNLYAYQVGRDVAHLCFGTPFTCVEWLRRELDFGPNITIVSHACVSAHLGMVLGTRALHAGLADGALVFSFDFISPFVAGGFHALKILNGNFPSPYVAGASGSIGLGDGAAFAVLSASRGEHVILGQSIYNEMHHFTANRSDGSGFAHCIGGVRDAVGDRKFWIKGHGTGTLEAGRLESMAMAEAFPNSPLLSWKGSFGHTLGSCGLVELAVARESMISGRVPGTIGSTGSCFTPQVALESFSNDGFDAVLCASNAFGGAHAMFFLAHD